MCQRALNTRPGLRPVEPPRACLATAARAHAPARGPRPPCGGKGRRPRRTGRARSIEAAQRQEVVAPHQQRRAGQEGAQQSPSGSGELAARVLQIRREQRARLPEKPPVRLDDPRSQQARRRASAPPPSQQGGDRAGFIDEIGIGEQAERRLPPRARRCSSPARSPRCGRCGSPARPAFPPARRCRPAGVVDDDDRHALARQRRQAVRQHAGAVDRRRRWR